MVEHRQLPTGETSTHGPESRALLEVKEFVTEFATPHGRVRAVDGVTFSLDWGRTMGIVGESGSGKTVLARSIMKLTRGSNVKRSGSVVFKGREILDAPPREMRKIWGLEMAMVFQDPMTTLHPLHRVGWQISEAIREHNPCSRTEARDRAVELLRSLGIPEPDRRYRQYPHQLSGGMRQRAIIGISLACDPDLLFADEPTTALDVTVQAQILDLLGQHQAERRMAMVLVSHDLAVVAGRTHDLIVMYGGQVVERGPTAAVLNKPLMPYTEALLESTPRLDSPSESRLPTIPGRPPNPVAFPPGCRFAPRCRYAQAQCLTEAPPLVADHVGGRQHRCLLPVGSDAATHALEVNHRKGKTAAGVPMEFFEQKQVT